MPRPRYLFAALLPAVVAVLGVFIAMPATGAAELPQIPKQPKVIHYPITIDVVGYVDYKWTYDNRETCSPGYSKTVTEELSLELGRPRRATLQIVGGSLVVFPVKGGEATLRTTLSGYQTTNYCPPTEPAKLPEPSCKNRMSSPLSAGLSTVMPDGDEELAPLGSDTQITLYRTHAEPQLTSCHEQRPKITTEREKQFGWNVDPYIPLAVPIGISNVKFWNLKPGQKLTGTTHIGGGCGKGTAHASAIPPTIKSCTLKGKIITIVKRVG